MPHLESYRTAGDGLRLFTQAWQPAAEAKAVLVLSHGQGDHSARYAHVGRALNSGGYAVCAYDLRGHGRSAGQRGHAPSYEALLDDLQLVYDAARGEYPGRKLFLFGHSTGGQLALNFAIRRRPDGAGVIVTSPWLRLVLPVPAWKVSLGRVLARVWPTFTFSNTLETVPLSRDSAFIQSLREPGLDHTKITARLGSELLDGAESALARAGDCRLPLLLLHGGEDSIADPEATRQFCERAGSADKTYRRYDGMYHEILNEFGREMVFSDILDWLDRHV